ncbi:hypothetical protein Y032_0086g1936 [Ancylostoma ceylanicum]|uniref:Uncharacterized protein n=1 Tax=Ancylostoma ceylanicum TaxID=53326 RepID=A0A016TPY0_9BILA|nr:hypothetical protein Y032_0086g1936 [Ancylostoma ceylanicum]
MTSEVLDIEIVEDRNRAMEILRNIWDYPRLQKRRRVVCVEDEDSNNNMEQELQKITVPRSRWSPLGWAGNYEVQLDSEIGD